MLSLMGSFFPMHGLGLCIDYGHTGLGAFYLMPVPSPPRYRAKSIPLRVKSFSWRATVILWASSTETL